MDIEKLIEKINAEDNKKKVSNVYNKKLTEYGCGLACTCVEQCTCESHCACNTECLCEWV